MLFIPYFPLEGKDINDVNVSNFCGPTAIFHCSRDRYRTLWRPAAFGDFREKKSETHTALRGNFSAPVRVTDLVEVSKDAASLLVCTRKKFFGWGMCMFCE